MLFFCLDSELTVSREFGTSRAIVGQNEESINFQSKGYYDKIKFAEDIMIYKERSKGEKSLSYKIKKWKLKGSIEITNDTSENITLLHL